MSDLHSSAQPATVETSRRDFLKQTTAAALATGVASQFAIARGAFAAGDDTIKIGSIGCGGRGTGAIVQALSADKNIKLVAMGDAFQDRLENCLKGLQQSEVSAKVAVDADHRFTGFDAYKQVIDSGVDVVLLTTPPHFRPMQLAYAIEKGKHVFCEKPVAVDAPGVRSVLATCEAAKKKNLAVVSGLCWRYDHGVRAALGQVLDGTIGEVLTIQASYNTNGLWMNPRKEGWSDMEWQLRNWLYFTWLSGDFNTEQHVHSLDKVAWAMKDVPPISCTGIGGRQVRTDPAYGNVFDHFSVVYEYANGVKAFSSCRQQDKCTVDVSDHFVGTKGTCHTKSFDVSITGEKEWKYKGPRPSMYQVEHDELFASIRNGKPINNGEYMSKSTMLAIMGRMSAYTGQTITWDQAFNSKEDLTPPKYDWIDLPVPPVAMPGKTLFV
ncbi:MAG: Gfo/Idh/MocA family oxidoreductase [Planctomycetales bacterium]|nr:Gfo/Idh/MocA family oxidoreductase [Planctomycetales bacterium]